VSLGIPVYFNIEARTQRIYNGCAHSVQSAGSRVGGYSKFPTSVQFGHHNFYASEFGFGLHIDWNATAVVTHLGGAISKKNNRNVCAVPS
jgi:hypothetical protein